MQLVRRYWVFALILFAYIALEMRIQPATVIYYSYGMSLGPHVLTNAIQYLARLALPWNWDVPYQWVGATILLSLYGIITIRTRSALMLLLGIEAILNTLPVLGFQPFVFDTRFLYLPAIIPAIVLALLIERGTQALKPALLRGAFALGITALLIGLNLAGVIQLAYQYTDKARVARTTFRHISQEYPTLPPDTYLYFINPPIRLRELSGMFYLRYGERVTVGGNEWGQPANWRAHSNPLIYFFDVQGRPVEIKPGHESQTSTFLDCL